MKSCSIKVSNADDNSYNGFETIIHVWYGVRISGKKTTWHIYETTEI